jgi:3,4-dihydroxy 2-butanone 4-phosphate synthase/GTP cyclohydrolase II
VQTYLVTIAIHWTIGPLSIESRYEKLEKLRQLAQANKLLLQEEVRLVASALFSQPQLIVHLGLDHPEAISSDWYSGCQHPIMKSIATVLDELATWPDLEQLAFLISGGDDPFNRLQVSLSRQVFHRGNPPAKDDLKPSDLCESLETQRIYIFSNHIPTD